MADTNNSKYYNNIAHNKVIKSEPIMKIIRKYAEIEYDFSRETHTDEESFEHFDLIFAEMFNELYTLIHTEIISEFEKPGVSLFINWISVFAVILLHELENISIEKDGFAFVFCRLNG